MVRAEGRAALATVRTAGRCWTALVHCTVEGVWSPGSIYKYFDLADGGGLRRDERRDGGKQAA